MSAVRLPLTRTYPLDDIKILRDKDGGDGRTVIAYAAVFGVPTEIVDAQGVYRESLARTAFNKTVSDRGVRFGVFYNHGKTLHGTASERGSMPIGTPIEPPKPDGRGLLTVTRYNRTPLADEVLAAIENGDITAQSFTARAIRSTPPPPRGGYRIGRAGELTDVVREELALIEYGPTPLPAYDEPMLVGVRSQGLGQEGWTLETLLRALNSATLGTPDLGPDAEGTPNPGAAEVESQEHSARMASLRWRARESGVL